MNNSQYQITKWASYLLLAALMVGGCVVIMHDATYELSDDTMIQARLGIGLPQSPCQPPVYTPKEGRFFPLGYQHFNVLLLFEPSGVSATTIYAMECVLWCLILLVFYWISFLSLPREAGIWRYIIPLCVATIIGQRILQFYTVLWTCSTMAFLLLALLILTWYYYCRDKKKIYLICLLFLTAYYTFCSETNIVVPFMICFCAVLNIGQEEKRDWPLIFSMAAIVVSFVTLYIVLIFPHINVSYDPAHGENVSYVENAVKILLNQKLLILTFLIFVWRLYKVFVCKEKYDTFSDTLLSTAVAIMCANLVLKLNYPIYYLPSIFLSVPAYMRILDCSTTRKTYLSIICVALVSLYFIPKYGKLIQSLWNPRTEVKSAMLEFDKVCEENEYIVYYMDEAENRGVQDAWAKGHLGNHLTYLRHSPALIYPEDSISGLTKFLLVTPVSHTKDEVFPLSNTEENDVKFSATAPGIIYYQICRGLDLK